MHRFGGNTAAAAAAAVAMAWTQHQQHVPQQQQPEHTASIFPGLEPAAVGSNHEAALMWQRQKSMGGFGHLTGAHASLESFELSLEQSEELNALQEQLRLAEVSISTSCHHPAT